VTVKLMHLDELSSPRSVHAGFAERVLPSASNLRVQASLDQKQRLQQLFFPDRAALFWPLNPARSVSVSSWPPKIVRICFCKDRRRWTNARGND
jgi:hypothetical protein